MSNLEKQLAVLTAIHIANAIPTGTNRLEFKAVKSGHFRLYIAVPGKASPDEVAALELIAEQHELYCSAFPHPKAATAVTFIDPDEQKA